MRLVADYCRTDEKVNIKYIHLHHKCHECIWGSEGMASFILVLTLDEGEWLASRPMHFTP